MKTIPLMEVAVKAPRGPRAVVPPARVASMPYRAYKPHPFTREERDSVTLLIGGLHWRAERIAQASMENLGYQVQVLPTATRDDLLTGREVADIGQCSPTSFTTGNLANFLRSRTKDIGAEEVSRKYVYVTFGACGACRFGQYHQSYELALRNVGLESFRMFLLAQGLDQDQARGDGLELNFPFLLGIAWAVILTDVVQDLEYQTRPFEVTPGATTRAARESVDYLYEVFRRMPRRGEKWTALGWHLTTGYFTARDARGAAAVRRGGSRSPAPEAGGETDRRVLPADRGRRQQLQHPSLAGRGRRGSLPRRHHDLARLPPALRRPGLRGPHRHRSLTRGSSSSAFVPLKDCCGGPIAACSAQSAACRTTCRISRTSAVWRRRTSTVV